MYLWMTSSGSPCQNLTLYSAMWFSKIESSYRVEVARTTIFAKAIIKQFCNQRSTDGIPFIRSDAFFFNLDDFILQAVITPIFALVKSLIFKVLCLSNEFFI